MIKKILFFVLVVSLTGLLTGCGPAAPTPITSNVTQESSDSTINLKIKDSYLKLDNHLSQVFDVFRAKGLAESEKYAATLLLTVKQGAIFVQLAIEDGHTSKELDNSVLQRLDVRIIAAASDLVDAWVPIGKLLELADKQAVIRRIQSPNVLMSDDSEGRNLVGARMFLGSSTSASTSTATPIAKPIPVPIVKTVVVGISNFSFVDQQLTVNRGDTVIWINNDPMAHSIISNDGKFSSNILSTGNSFRFTFTKSGTYPYHCGIHASMTGTITVK